MSASAALLGWLAETLVASTLLMLVVLALRRPVARAFGARAAYLLWWLPALRMILPALPAPVLVAVPRVVPRLDLHLDLARLARTAAAAPAPDAARIDWTAAALALWLGGAALFLAAQMLGYRRFVARALAGAAPLGAERGVPVHACDRVAGPLAAGIVRRRILVPRDFATRYDADERRLALAHEAAHHYGHDLIANAAALGVLALHWFNPVARAAFRAFRADQELACDARVLARAGAQDVHAYGSALVKAAWGNAPAAACGLRGAEQLKRRLRMMRTHRNGALRRVSGAALALALVGGGLALTASGGAGARAATRTVTRTVRVIATPLAPAAPEAPEALEAPEAPEPPVAVVPPMRIVSAATAPATPRTPVTPTTPVMPTTPLAPVTPATPLAPVTPPPPAPPAPMSALDGSLDRDIAETIRAALEDARVEMAEACEKAGTPVDPDDKWETLALCGDRRETIDRQIVAALAQARAEIARQDMPARIRAKVLASLDREIAAMRRER